MRLFEKVERQAAARRTDTHISDVLTKPTLFGCSGFRENPPQTSPIPAERTFGLFLANDERSLCMIVRSEQVHFDLEAQKLHLDTGQI